MLQTTETHLPKKRKSANEKVPTVETVQNENVGISAITETEQEVNNMAKPAYTFATEEDFQAAIQPQLDALKAKYEETFAELTDRLEKMRANNSTADYSTYAEFPELAPLLKAANLRPQALPALCALHIWRGLHSAKDIAAAIGTTPLLSETEGGKQRGGVPATAKLISGALQKLQKALLTANTGAGIKVTSIRGPEGDSTVKRIRFAPMVMEDFDASAGDNGAATGESAAA